MTLALYSKITLHTAQIWLTTPIIFFLNLKIFLCDVRYPNNEWLKAVVEAWLEGQM